MKRLSWSRRMLPVVVVQLFLWSTLALYAFGPWDWPMRDPGRFYAFVAAAHGALFLGYVSAAHAAPGRAVSQRKLDRLIDFSLWSSLAVLPLTSYARTGRLIPDFIGGLRDPGQAYADSLAFQEGGGSNAAAYVRILLSPWLVALLPLVVFFWGRLTWSRRSLALVTLAGIVLITVATGQRREIADLLTTLPFVAIAGHWTGVTRYSRRTIVAASALVAVGLTAFTGFFVYSHVSRIGRQTAGYGANPATRQLPDFDNPMLAALPPEAQPGFLGLANYLTTGYYGLSLAVDRDVKPMWGAGHSMFLTRNVAKFSNDPAYEGRSLPVQISEKDDFRYPVLWCTAYPYFANDVGWLGTIVLLFLLGQAMAVSWIDLLGGKNPYAIVFFSLTMVVAFYLPATNRMLQDGEGVTAFYGWLAVFLAHRARS